MTTKMLVALLLSVLFDFHIGAMNKKGDIPKIKPHKVEKLKEDVTYQFKSSLCGKYIYVFSMDKSNKRALEKLEANSLMRVGGCEDAGFVLSVYNSGKTIFVAGWESGYMYDSVTNKVVFTFEVPDLQEHIFDVGRNGKYFACAKHTGAIYNDWSEARYTIDESHNELVLYSYDDKREPSKSNIRSEHNNKFTCLKFSPVDDFLVVGLQDGHVWLLHVTGHIDSKCVRKYYVEEGRSPVVMRGVTEDKFVNSAMCISFGRRGTLFAVGSRNNSVYLWGVAQDKCLKVFSGHRHPISCVKISPDEKYIASKEFFGDVRLWKIADGTCMAIISYMWPRAEIFNPMGHGDILFTYDQKQIVVCKPSVKREKDRLAVIEFAQIPERCWIKTWEFCKEARPWEKKKPVYADVKIVFEFVE